jgi:hypothetical protein
MECRIGNKIATELMKSQNIPIMAEYLFDVKDNPREALEREFNNTTITRKRI